MKSKIVWVRRYELNHGLATFQKQSDTLASVESVWDQIKKNICKESQNDIERAKNPVKSSGVQSDRLDNCQVFKDRKKLEIIKKLRKELVRINWN